MRCDNSTTAPSSSGDPVCTVCRGVIHRERAPSPIRHETIALHWSADDPHELCRGSGQPAALWVLDTLPDLSWLILAPEGGTPNGPGTY